MKSTPRVTIAFKHYIPVLLNFNDLVRLAGSQFLRCHHVERQSTPTGLINDKLADRKRASLPLGTNGIVFHR